MKKIKEKTKRRTPEEITMNDILNPPIGWCGCEGYPGCSACKVVGLRQVLPRILEKYKKAILK
jgi:hypothetical protein